MKMMLGLRSGSAPAAATAPIKAAITVSNRVMESLRRKQDRILVRVGATVKSEPGWRLRCWYATCSNSSRLRPRRIAMTDTVERISPQDAMRHLRASPPAVLVCAYDDSEKFQQNRLDGALSLA